MIDFSIIIPVYNVENYVDECLKSIENISHQATYEVLIINDGSTDNSANICKEYCDKYPNVYKLISQENQGQAAARNTGIKAAQGEYLLFLDGDDYWGNRYLDELKERFIDNSKEYDVIVGHGLITDDGIEKIDRSIDLEADQINYRPSEEVLGYLIERWQGAGFSVCWNIYRREFILKHQLFFKVGLLCEDAEWAFKPILKACRIGYFDKTYYCYRINRPGSTMTKPSYKRWRDYVEITNEWISLSKTMKDQEVSKKLVALYAGGCFKGLNEVASFNKEEQRASIKILKKSLFFDHPSSMKEWIIVMISKLIGINGLVYVFTKKEKRKK